MIALVRLGVKPLRIGLLFNQPLTVDRAEWFDNVQTLVKRTVLVAQTGIDSL
jgi:hypothetical protein